MGLDSSSALAREAGLNGVLIQKLGEEKKARVDWEGDAPKTVDGCFVIEQLGMDPHNLDGAEDLAGLLAQKIDARLIDRKEDVRGKLLEVVFDKKSWFFDVMKKSA